MIITVLKRYDENGAWTHDIDVRFGVITQDDLRNSQWSVDEYIDLTQIKKNIRDYEKLVKEMNEEIEWIKGRLSLLMHRN